MQHLSITVENQDVAIIYRDKVMQSLRCSPSGGRRKEKKRKMQGGNGGRGKGKEPMVYS